MGNGNIYLHKPSIYYQRQKIAFLAYFICKRNKKTCNGTHNHQLLFVLILVYIVGAGSVEI